MLGPKGLGKLKKKIINLIGSRTYDLPACSILLQPLRYSVPPTIHFYLLEHIKSLCMQLLLTMKRHFTVTLWMPVRLSATAPAWGSPWRSWRSMIGRVEWCTEWWPFWAFIMNSLFLATSRKQCHVLQEQIKYGHMLVTRQGVWIYSTSTTHNYKQL
jgi:hypothetical protein